MRFTSFFIVVLGTLCVYLLTPPTGVALSTENKQIFVVARDAESSTTSIPRRKKGKGNGNKNSKAKTLQSKHVVTYVKRGKTFKAFFGFNPYGNSFTGGVRVATGDVNGDGFLDIVTAPGPTTEGNPEIQVWTLKNLKRLKGPTAKFNAFDAGFAGGVNVAVGDVNGDGITDIITGTASQANLIRIFDGTTGSQIREFNPYVPTFTGGVSVAAGDVNGDGIAEVITAPASNDQSLVRVFDGRTGDLVTNRQVAQFFAYDSSFTGGVFVAAGDINGDGSADIITGAGQGGGPHVKVFSGADGSQLDSFFAFDSTYTGGVRVGAGNFNADGFDDIIVGAHSSNNPHVQIFDGANTGSALASFFAFNSGYTGGVFVSGGL